MKYLFFISLIFLSLVDVNGYEGKLNYNFSSGLTYDEKTAQREFIADAPWRIESNENIPIFFEIRDSNGTGYAYSFYSINIYDENDAHAIAYTVSLNELGLAVDGSCSGNDYATITDNRWYTTLFFSPNLFTKDLNNKINLSILYSGSVCGGDSDVTPDNRDYLIINVNNNLPKVDNWYCGDTHYHSEYTDTKFFASAKGEFGGSLNMTISSLNVIGFDWITITDHSNSFSRHKEDELNWENFKPDCNSYDKCLIGSEINCDYNLVGGGNHLLAYNYTEYIEDNFIGFFSPNNPFCSVMINNVTTQKGFSYVAHPESIFDKAGAIVNTWHNYSLPFTGLEIWNGDLDDEQAREDLDNGLQKWKNLSLAGRKVFISAGSDAHGDFNTKFGKAMTCVYSDVNSSSAGYKENIFNSLKTGKSYITNNGALKFEIQTPHKRGIRLGETANAYYSDEINMTVDYDAINPCNLNLYKGIIGDRYETLVNGFGVIENNGNKIYTDIINNNQYYRIECINSFSNKRIYTNPVWINAYNSSYKSNWSTYNKDAKLSSIQSGTSAFDIGHTSKTMPNGTGYQPLIADVDADLDNEIIIFSNDYLMLFDSNLTLKAQEQLGSLRGQSDIVNYDNDSFLEIIAVLQNNNSDNYTVIEYNGTNFKIEQSFDVTSQGGYQNIKCLDFDNDNVIDCIFKDYNGYLHSYNVNSDEDNLDYKIGLGTSSNSPEPAFADFDNDEDLDLLIEHNYTIALIDKDKNLRNVSIADEYESIWELGGIKVEFCANKKHHLRFANLTGNLSIIWVAGCDEKERTEKRKSKMIVLNNDLTKKFVKQCYWSSFDCVYVSRAYTHACKYNDPLIYDYNNDGFDEIIITHERNSQSVDNDELGIEIEVFNSSGDLVYVNEISGPEFEYESTCSSLGLEGASYADMNNDNKLDIITTKGIFNLSLTNITGDFSLSAQQPVPVDLNQDGFLDLIWSKQEQTKIFISKARPSCSDRIKNQDEIDIDCGGVCGICLDSDNDGIADRYDKLYGNSSDISSNFGLISIFIGSSENITQRFDSSQLIEFKKDNKSILYFNFDFYLKNLNLSKIVINKQTDNKTGYILVKGINATGEKTVYIDNLNTTIETICIKDQEIDSIYEISFYCNETNEFLIECNSEEYFGYNCSNSSSQYKITGLSHSGAKQQQDAIRPSFAG